MAKLLIVDDDKEVTDSITRFLKAMGYDAKCAYDSDEAIKLIKSNKPDCVLLDIQLLGSTDGIGVLRETKKINKNIKVIMITAFIEQETEEECKKIGAEGYIIKPLDFQKLLDMIKEVTKV